MSKEVLELYQKPHDMYLRTLTISGRVVKDKDSTSKQKGRTVQTTYSRTWYVKDTNFMDDNYLIGHIKNVVGTICDRISHINADKVRLYKMSVGTVEFSVQTSIPMNLLWEELLLELESK